MVCKESRLYFLENYPQLVNEDEIKFLNKLKERIKGYACGEHKELVKMIDNRIKEKERVTIKLKITEKEEK